MHLSSALLILPLIAVVTGGAAPDLSSRAKANLAELVSDADYPDSAIRAGEQGIVGFQLDVAADGRVTACRITSTSGSATLDATTCRIMTERAQFTPAHDRKGRPIADHIHSRMKWVLPREAPPAPSQPPPDEAPPS